MNKHLLSILAMFCFVGVISAQSFSDDFESYNIGDFIGQQSSTWTTWSGATGNAEDAAVTDARAASGSKSIYFAGAAAGGPQDVILPFGGKYTTGQFDMSMNFYVASGNNAYFNFQGERTVGQVWVLNVFLNDDGTVNVTNGSNVSVLGGTYTQDAWVNVAINVNLTSNSWSLSLDGECLGAFMNPVNNLASLDLFPLNGTSIFYVDDVSFDYDATAGAPVNDAAIGTSINNFNVIAGNEVNLEGMVTNVGTDPISSFDVTMTAGATSLTKSYSGLTLGNGQAAPYAFDDPYMVVDGNNQIVIKVDNVNGVAGDDENICNSTLNLNLNGFTPAANKKVFVEEATGTWCQWCPRGDVFMNLMDERYPDWFVGAAVHNNDPMVVTEWDEGIGSFISGYPDVAIMRATSTDPSTMEPDIISRLQVAPDVWMEHGAEFDEATRELKISITTNFVNSVTGDNRLIIAMTEDGVTGTGAGYNQSNAFSGGGSGPMGDYHNLPNPVPASQMVYNHVSRLLLTPFDGLPNAYGGNVDAGSTRTHGFSVVIPEEYDIANMHIISAFRNIFGQIDNANSSTVDEAINLGLSTNTYDVELETSAEVFPNPFNDITNIKLDLDSPQDVTIQVTDAMGKVVATRFYGTVYGNQVFQFDGSNLTSGVYYIRIKSGDKFATKRVSIAR